MNKILLISAASLAVLSSVRQSYADLPSTTDREGAPDVIFASRGFFLNKGYKIEEVGENGHHTEEDLSNLAKRSLVNDMWYLIDTSSGRIDERRIGNYLDAKKIESDFTVARARGVRSVFVDAGDAGAYFLNLSAVSAADGGIHRAVEALVMHDTIRKRGAVVAFEDPVTVTTVVAPDAAPATHLNDIGIALLDGLKHESGEAKLRENKALSESFENAAALYSQMSEKVSDVLSEHMFEQVRHQKVPVTEETITKAISQNPDVVRTTVATAAKEVLTASAAEHVDGNGLVAGMAAYLMQESLKRGDAEIQPAAVVAENFADSIGDKFSRTDVRDTESVIDMANATLALHGGFLNRVRDKTVDKLVRLVLENEKEAGRVRVEEIGPSDGASNVDDVRRSDMPRQMHVAKRSEPSDGAPIVEDDSALMPYNNPYDMAFSYDEESIRLPILPSFEREQSFGNRVLTLEGLRIGQRTAVRNMLGQEDSIDEDLVEENSAKKWDEPDREVIKALDFLAESNQ
jgi:hypothetical protein